MSHVFISYAADDRSVAARVAKELAKGKRKGWLDIKDIRLGQPWREEIDDALRSAEVVIVILTPESCRSQYLTYEWSFALGAGVRILPLLVTGMSLALLHKRLQSLQCLDLSQTAKPWGRLFKELNSASHSRKHEMKLSLISNSPILHAEFELEDGQPIRVGKSYKIWVSTKNVPAGTKQIKYRILDETFDKRRFKVGRGKVDFADWITSYGDIYLAAKGKSRGRVWRAQSTLAEALRRHYGLTPKRKFEKAIVKIENN